MPRRILITGGTGLLGHGFAAIAGKHPDLEFIRWGSRDCDLTDEADVFDKIGLVKPDNIIHVAAISGGIGLSMKHPATMLRSNVRMDLNVLEAARRRGVGKTVMSLSVGFYPVNAPVPLNEASINDGPPAANAAGYALAKRLTAQAIKDYRHEYGLDVIGLVPNGIFGPHDHFNEQEGTMLASLIRRFFEHREGHEPLAVWGDGTPLREYTYAPDMADAYIWALRNYNEAEALNVGCAEEHSIREIAMTIAECMGIDKERIFFDTTKPNGVHRRPTDNSRFLRLSNFRYTNFTEALAGMIDWYKTTRKTAPHDLRTASKMRRYVDARAGQESRKT